MRLYQKNRLSLLLVFAIGTSLLDRTSGFASVVGLPKNLATPTPTKVPTTANLIATTPHCHASASVALFQNKSPPDYSGSGRGVPIFIAVLLACTWFFTIPPYFRRSYICPSERCELNRSVCNDCITPDEFKAGIKEYYANGGGIEWDFSIDPANKLF